MDFSVQYKILVESLKMLALSERDQKALLPEFVDVQDEVINNFFEAFLLLPQLVENNYLSLKAIAAILRVNNKIETMPSAVKELEKIKNLAVDSLKELGEEFTKPDLSSFDWISS
jgi:hypothetical protein